eukprot:TRINITY_DN4697_c0_g1_i2.p2 TRINITY_DN4697_c0_g1~~TRINITY_DN4697_c0_g1_i2.p2  ORF type:complete len:108 (-),score=35.02 TRINITY_DN4697_c0_g1_i2:60-383(-)
MSCCFANCNASSCPDFLVEAAMAVKPAVEARMKETFETYSPKTYVEGRSRMAHIGRIYLIHVQVGPSEMEMLNVEVFIEVEGEITLRAVNKRKTEEEESDFGCNGCY